MKSEISGVFNNKFKFRNEKLPVPGNILSMFNGKKTDHEDDPTLHSGRTRSFAHERGNWASFVSIPCKITRDGFVKLQAFHVRLLGKSFVGILYKIARYGFVSIPCKITREGFVSIPCKITRGGFVIVPCEISNKGRICNHSM